MVFRHLYSHTTTSTIAQKSERGREFLACSSRALYSHLLCALSKIVILASFFLQKQEEVESQPKKQCTVPPPLSYILSNMLFLHPPSKGAPSRWLHLSALHEDDDDDDDDEDDDECRLSILGESMPID